MVEWSVRNPPGNHSQQLRTGLTKVHVSIPHNFQRMLDYCHRKMRPVIHESCNIILGHLRQLLLKDALQTCQDNEAVP